MEKAGSRSRAGDVEYFATRTELQIYRILININARSKPFQKVGLPEAYVIIYLRDRPRQKSIVVSSAGNKTTLGSSISE